jgi:hypothetical protein
MTPLEFLSWAVAGVWTVVFVAGVVWLVHVLFFAGKEKP